MCLVIRYLADLLFCVIKSSTWNYRYLCPRPDTCTATVLLYNWPTRNIFLWIRFEHVGSALSAYPPGNENSESYGLRSPSLDLAVESCSQVQKRLHIAFLKTWEYWSVLRLLFYHIIFTLPEVPIHSVWTGPVGGVAARLKQSRSTSAEKGHVAP